MLLEAKVINGWASQWSFMRAGALGLEGTYLGMIGNISNVFLWPLGQSLAKCMLAYS